MKGMCLCWSEWAPTCSGEVDAYGVEDPLQITVGLPSHHHDALAGQGTVAHEL